MDFYRILERAYAGEYIDTAGIAVLLEPPGADAEKALFETAYRLKSRICGRIVNLRGLVEFSNICTRDCFYCGIRKSNSAVHRYTMEMDEIISAVQLAGEFGYGSVVLQSGERSDEKFTGFVEEILLNIRKLPFDLGITLSCGEQSLETYRRWRRAGAKRYLLRIESSSEKIFRAIHPAEAVFAERKAALERLKAAGFQTGSGVMIGLPGQSAAELAADVDFFRTMDLDMIGMGPFLPQEDTPLGQRYPDAPGAAEKRLIRIFPSPHILAEIKGQTGLVAVKGGHTPVGNDLSGSGAPLLVQIRLIVPIPHRTRDQHAQPRRRAPLQPNAAVCRHIGPQSGNLSALKHSRPPFPASSDSAFQNRKQ